MKKRSIRIISIILVSALLLMGCTSMKEEAQTGVTADEKQTIQEDSTGTTSTDANASSEVIVDTDFTARDLEVGYEETTATKIILNGDSIAVSGEGAVAAGNILTIGMEGSYVVEGNLKDGQIIIDAGENDKIQLILNGASITCLSNAPIYVKNAAKVFVTLAKGTDNSLIDGSEYIQSDENEVDGVIYSKSDLTLNGSGALTIIGNYKHGIVSKDELVITGGSYDIDAVKDAINGKDCVKIKAGELTLNAANGNGIQSKNEDDTTKGYVYIDGGTIDIVSSVEGIEGTVIVIEDGIININSSDDGLNAASPNTEATTDTTMVPAAVSDSSTDRTMTAQEPVERMPEAAPNSRKLDGEFPGGMGGRGDFGGENPFEVDKNCYIRISGGVITVNAEGDGIDSNGALSISGGTIYVNGPTENMNASLDYVSVGEITGGTVVATGSAGMAQGFGETSTQCSILYNLTSTASADTAVTLTNSEGKEVINLVPSKQYQSVVISSPELIQGETYTLTCGNQNAEVTLSSITTRSGQSISMGERGMNR